MEPEALLGLACCWAPVSRAGISRFPRGHRCPTLAALRRSGLQPDGPAQQPDAHRRTMTGPWLLLSSRFRTLQPTRPRGSSRRPGVLHVPCGTGHGRSTNATATGRPVQATRPGRSTTSASSTSWGVQPARRNSRTADPTARSDPAQPASNAIRQAAARSSRRVTVSVWSGQAGAASRAREGSSLREETRGVPVTGTASPSGDGAVFRGVARRYTAAWFPCPGRFHSGRSAEPTLLARPHSWILSPRQ